ncbi:hypothetical protein [Paraburkholderia xenovorans]|uniref:hypothetical protein n=1 Tax=Paraburkholderia xenovorans TaxID=36873 RepID=UPI0038990E8E
MLDQAARLRFTGIDLSPTMIAAARCRNAAFVRDGQVRLETGMSSPCRSQPPRSTRQSRSTAPISGPT